MFETVEQLKERERLESKMWQVVHFQDHQPKKDLGLVYLSGFISGGDNKSAVFYKIEPDGKRTEIKGLDYRRALELCTVKAMSVRKGQPLPKRS